MRARVRSILIAAFIVSMGCGIGPCGPQTTPTKGDLYYTLYSGSPNLKKVHFDFDGSKFKLSGKTGIAKLPQADGVIFGPDGALLVGGGEYIYHVKPSNGQFDKYKSSGNALHLAADKNGGILWSGGVPGPLLKFPLSPLGSGSEVHLSGDDLTVTSIAFDSHGNAYYTNASPGGDGSVGTIDLSSGKTHRVIEALPAAHGMVYDSYSDTLMLFGANHVTQLDPNHNLKVVSDRKLPSPVNQLDQGTVDDKGHVFAAENGGYLVFLDYSNDKKVGSGAFLKVVITDPAMDDVAPLTGPGAKPTGGPFGLCAPNP